MRPKSDGGRVRSDMNLTRSLLTLTCGLALLAPAQSLAATASISGPDTVVRGETEQYLGSCVGCGGSTIYYEWDRDNDGVVPEVDKGLYRPIIFHAYEGALGQRTMKLSVQGYDFMTGKTVDSATVTKTVTVVNAPPEVEFTCDPTRVETRESVTCEIDAVDDPDTEQAVALAWDVDGDGFDDGTGDEITFSYPTEGEKTVRLRGTDGDGGATVADRGVDVWAPAPGQAFAMSATAITAGDEVTFTAAYEAGEEGDSAYERRWDFDGDGTWDESGLGKRVVSEHFDEPGTYSVRLRVAADGDPESAKVTTQQLVVKPRPVVDETPKDNGGGGGGGSQGTPAPGPAAPAPAVTTPGPVALARTIAPVAKQPAVKKPAAKRTCKTVKAKKGKKKTTKCAAKKKAKSRAKTRGTKRK